MRRCLVLVTASVVMLAAHVSLGLDQGVILELVVADQRPSSSAGSTWGWWNPGKYDTWDVGPDSDLGLAEARMLVSGERYTIVLGGEWYPKIHGTGSFDDLVSGEEVIHEVSMETAAYDLGIGQFFGKSARTGVMPWIGATYVRTTESRVADPESESGGVEDRATSGLWGVVVGADASIRVWSVLDVTGRLLFRWASGTRNADLGTSDSGTGQTGSVSLSDGVDQSMFGVDLGLRWDATRVFELEAGWRYRDWTLSDGPASYGGPYLKAAFTF